MYNNFLDAYRIYAAGNEASPLFHEWAGLSTLSAVVSRKVFFDQKYFKVYPNLYVVLVGEPGDKKTTAMVLARSMAQKLDMPIAPPSITKEAITVLMSAENEKSKCHRKFIHNLRPVEVTHLSFFASEIVTLLSAGGNPQGLIEFFTDIYDREAFEVMTKNKGTDLINAPYITMLACMTPEQTGRMLKENLITGGFSRRCVFVYGRSKATPIAFPDIIAAQSEALTFCQEHLKKVKEIHCEYAITPDAKEFFTTWYNEKHRQLSLPHSAVFKNWLRSKDTMAIKVAMLLDLAGEMQGVLTTDILRASIKMLDATEKDLNKVLAGAGTNPLAELAQKILSRLEEAPNNRLSKKQLLAGLYDYGDLEQIDKALDYLIRTDVVQRGFTQGPSPVEILTMMKPEG